ncbi:MAG: GNAT family N-acetyltransferase [Lachnospiraceae bacterium]|nr:GNAT family N-acetyltransferase [Lachnospiraceae bacterium]
MEYLSKATNKSEIISANASYLALDSLTDLSRKCSRALGRDYGENAHYTCNRSFDYQNWYSRINIKDANAVKGGEAAKLAGELKALCTETDSPKFLTLSIEDVSEDLEIKLTDVGFKLLKEQKGMLYNPSDSMKNSSANAYHAQIELLNAENIEKNIEQFAYIGERAFGNGGKLEAFKIFAKDDNCKFYMITAEDGVPAATALLNVFESVVEYDGVKYSIKNGGIHEVATLPEYRNRGYATALIERIISDAEEMQLDILSLQASVFGEPVYKRIGFDIVSHIKNYSVG